MSSSTVNSPNLRTTAALDSGLKAAGINPENISSAIERTRLINWLTAWISNGNDGLTTDRINAAKKLFEAKNEAAINMHAAAVLQKLTSLETIYTNIFAVDNGSRAILGIIPNPSLALIESALMQAQGSRKIAEGEDNANLTKQMNMLMHQLIDAAAKHEASSEHKANAFTDKLIELVNHNSASFSQEFINQFKLAIAERKQEAMLDQRIYKYEGAKVEPEDMLTDLMRLLKTSREGSPLIKTQFSAASANEIYTQWNVLSAEARAKAQNEAKEFLISASNGNLAGLNEESTKIMAVQEGMNGLSKEAQLFVQMKVRELQTAETLHRHEGDLMKQLGELFGEGFFSKALVTAVMGFLGGSIFGSPMAGIFLTTVVSLLGSLSSDKDSALKPAPVKKAA